jgi:hypothetical protein
MTHGSTNRPVIHRPPLRVAQLDQASMKDILHTLHTLQYTACVKMEQLES